MADGDHYISYDRVRYILANSGLGRSGNTMYDDNNIEEALDQTLNMIHFELGWTSKTTDTVIIGQLAKIQADLVSMMVMRARMFKENNLSDSGTIMNFWQMAPTFTRDHQRILNMIRGRANGNSFAYNLKTGARL